VLDATIHCEVRRFTATAIGATIGGMNALVLHRHPLSGHCHRVELMLSLLDLPAKRIDVDLVAGEQKRPAFLAKNPFGQVPVLEDGDVTIADSAAIVTYLVRRYGESTAWIPRDPVAAAQVQRWLAVAAGPLASGPAFARAAAIFRRAVDTEPARSAARSLFARMDDHVADRAFFAGDAPTIADVALYAYTAHAPEGGVSLEPFANVRRWIGRVEAMPRFVPMPSTATPEREQAR
jgi:glutathione S-transferase